MISSTSGYAFTCDEILREIIVLLYRKPLDYKKCCLFVCFVAILKKHVFFSTHRI